MVRNFSIPNCSISFSYHFLGLTSILKLLNCFKNLQNAKNNKIQYSKPFFLHIPSTFPQIPKLVGLYKYSNLFGVVNILEIPVIHVATARARDANPTPPKTSEATSPLASSTLKWFLQKFCFFKTLQSIEKKAWKCFYAETTWNFSTQILIRIGALPETFHQELKHSIDHIKARWFYFLMLISFRILKKTSYEPHKIIYKAQWHNLGVGCHNIQRWNPKCFKILNTIS